jgi:hypothetical protein
MRHFSCDLCGTDMTATSDSRFVLRMEVSEVASPEFLNPGHDSDPVEAMADLLDEAELHPPIPSQERLEFDLCPGCRRKFVADPLGRERARTLRFSQN